MAIGKWRIGIVAVLAGAAIAGCKPEQLASPTNPAEIPSNSPPTIGGSPATSATVGSLWQFIPSASDPDGDSLTFTATGLPGWMRLDSRSGRLWGTPSSDDQGTASEIVIRVSDGNASASLPPFTVTVIAVAGNRAPSISGTPATNVRVGSAYSFAPSASDPDRQELTFSIVNKPSWASFSTTSGRLSGTPTESDVGTTSGIVITVTDSQGATASLPAFSITVEPAPATRGSAVLDWLPPVQYTDGTPLTAAELGAFRIYHGTSASQLSRIEEVPASTTTYTVSNLAPGTHYFAVTAVSVDGVESLFSSTGTKTIQ